MSFHISQRFIDELLEEDCPYMDLTVEALGGREPGLLTCHPKAACVVAGVEVAVRLLESSGCRVACEAASGERLEAGQCFCAPKARRGHPPDQNRAERHGIFIRHHPRSGHVGKRAQGQSPCAAGRYPQAFPGTNGFRLRRRKLAEPSRIGSAFSDSLLVFDQHRVFTGGLDSPPGCPSAARRFRKKLGAEVATPEEALLLARAGIDSIQCERFTCADLEETVRGVKAVNAAVQVLAAGGVTGENAAAVAATGVDVLVTTWAYFGKPADIKMVVSA